MSSALARARAFFEACDGKDRQRIGGEDEPTERLALYQELAKGIERVASDLKGIPKPDERTIALARRSAEILFELEPILTAADPDSVSWCERRERSVVLRSSPIDVSALIRRHLLERKRAVVLTSATLGVDGSFEYVCRRLGVEPREEKILGSPFDFRRQSLLYVALSAFSPACRLRPESGRRGTRAHGGEPGSGVRAFTTFTNLHAVRRLLQPCISFRLLVQGECRAASSSSAFAAPGAPSFSRARSRSARASRQPAPPSELGPALSREPSPMPISYRRRDVYALFREDSGSELGG